MKIKELKSANESITWWTNRFNAVEKENKKLNKQLEMLFKKEYPFIVENGIICRKNKKIENLQEELKYQKQAEQEYNEKHTKLMKKYKELQEKIDKAIEYLEQPYRDNFDYSKAELLNILNGGDDNVK